MKKTRSNSEILYAYGNSLRDISINDIINEFIQVRKKTLEIFKPLKIEDTVIQSNTFGSPPNWHIAHVSWFFHKVLEKHSKRRTVQSNNDNLINLEYLNSYYQRFGKILPKSDRGKFPRPTVEQTLHYREFIDRNIISFLKEQKWKEENKENGIEELKHDIILANQHEMQHQELMIYDFQHYFQRFPDPNDNYMPIIKLTPPLSLSSLRQHSLHPISYLNQSGKKRKRTKRTRIKISSLQRMVTIPEGIYELGFNGRGFCYDNELPLHKVYLQQYKIDVFPVTNGDYVKFIDDGGYRDYSYWLADGWDLVKEYGWDAPLYWENNDSNRVDSNINDSKGSRWLKKDFHGIHEINMYEPVVNISYYEADAYARWAGKRLPTEAEWEKAASWNEDLQRKMYFPWGDEKPEPNTHSNLLESHLWGPVVVDSYPEGKSYYGCYHMIGNVWEWTSSEYVLYPGFKSKFLEYTDKWAINQKVLRGGCFATPANQIRNSYRNYFKPYERILFAGFRCAEDI